MSPRLLPSVTHSPGLAPRGAENGCGWKGPLDVTLSKPPAQAGHLEQAARGRTVLGRVPNPCRDLCKAAPCICIYALARQPKVFQKGDFSREALYDLLDHRKSWMPVLTEGQKGAEFLQKHEKKCM